MKEKLKEFYRFIFKFKSVRRLRKLRKILKLDSSVQIQMDIVVSSPEKLTIQDYVYIGPNAHIQALGGVFIGRGTIFGPSITIYSANHRFKGADSIPYDRIYDLKPVIIEENVWIGGGVIIVPGTKIGEGAIIGAGSVVAGSVPAMSVVVGNPARVISQRDPEEYQRLKSEDKIYLKIKNANNH